MDLGSKTIVRTIVDNAALQAKIDALQKGPHEFFRVDVGEGVSLDAWMMKPPNFDPAKKYPVLFYAYTEPAGTTVNDQWQGAQYLWFLIADAARLRRRQHRQPRHAFAKRPSVSQEHL